MTPKEKAQYLIDKYIQMMPCLHNQTGSTIMLHAKQSSLIAVDEILQVIEDNSLEYDDNFWDKVKTEIEKL